jgi:hypothetical protein
VIDDSQIQVRPSKLGVSGNDESVLPFRDIKMVLVLRLLGKLKVLYRPCIKSLARSPGNAKKGKPYSEGNNQTYGRHVAAGRHKESMKRTPHAPSLSQWERERNTGRTVQGSDTAP